MKKSALYVQNEASRKYNPYTLKDFLTRLEDGTVIVDRSRLLKNKDDERLFCVVLNRDYGWGYRHPDTTTIYFVVEDDKVYGGCYEPNIGRLTKRLVAELSTGHLVYHHIYSSSAMMEICNAISNA